MSPAQGVTPLVPPQAQSRPLGGRFVPARRAAELGRGVRQRLWPVLHRLAAQRAHPADQLLLTPPRTDRNSPGCTSMKDGAGKTPAPPFCPASSSPYGSWGVCAGGAAPHGRCPPQVTSSPMGLPEGRVVLCPPFRPPRALFEINPGVLAPAARRAWHRAPSPLRWIWPGDKSSLSLINEDGSLASC